MKKIIHKVSLCFLIFSVMICGCGSPSNVSTINLSKDLRSSELDKISLDDDFIQTSADFAVELFKNSLSDHDNTLISPLSVMIALSMCANGADHNTLEEIEEMLGNLSIDQLNQYLYSFISQLSSDDQTKFNIANSIWYRDNDSFHIDKDFLQNNLNYYHAQAFLSSFDQDTVQDINEWVKNNTNNMIDSIIDTIYPTAIMIIMNALCFDGKWENTYQKFDISNDLFNCYHGKRKTIEMMHSYENEYLIDENATGFVKHYKGNHYSFAAILPNEEIDIFDYIESLNSEKFLRILSNPQNIQVNAKLPKFEIHYSLILNDILKNMGVIDAFDDSKADFSKMGRSNIGNLFISEVFHKTYISVNEEGTQAAAVTDITVCESAAINEAEVVLNRPFIFMIIDDFTNFPIFIGTVLDIGE